MVSSGNYSAKTSTDNQIYTNQRMKHFDCTARDIYHNGEIHNQIQCNYHDLHLFFHQSGTALG